MLFTIGLALHGAMFLTTTVIAFANWYFRKNENGWLYASAVLAGSTVAAKLNAAFGLPVMLAIALWSLTTQLKKVAVCALLLLLVASPWYAVTYFWTGNPVISTAKRNLQESSMGARKSRHEC